MRQKLFVRRAPERGAACEHGRLEPAAMLVAAFQIQIGRPSQFFALFQHGIMRAARIKPNVHGVGQFVVLRAVFGRQNVGFVQFKPCVDAFFFNFLGDFFQQFGRIGVQLPCFFVREKRHRRAPITLAGNHPVGALLNHRLQAGAPPCGEKFGVVHRLQRIVAQRVAFFARFVHADKPLRCGAVNQRSFVSPAMGVAVFNFAAGKQASFFFQPFQNDGIGFPHGFACHARHAVNKPPCTVNRVDELDVVLLADKIVFHTMRGRGVHQACTRIGGNVTAV